jgi:hypothetical protein
MELNGTVAVICRIVPNRRAAGRLAKKQVLNLSVSQGFTTDRRLNPKSTSELIISIYAYLQSVFLVWCTTFFVHHPVSHFVPRGHPAVENEISRDMEKERRWLNTQLA